MKATKKLSSKCGFTIPKQIRLDTGILPGQALDIEITGDGIMLRKHSRTCRFCGAAEDVITVSGIDMCRGCAANLVREVQRHGV